MKTKTIALVLAPLLVLGAAAVWLQLHWNDIPSRFAVHWGRAGVPNGWANRDAMGVYSAFLFGVGLWGVLQGVAALVAWGPGQDERHAPIKRATAAMVRYVSLATSFVVARVAIALPLEQRVTPASIIGLAGVALLVALGVGAWGIAAALREVRASGPAEELKGYTALYYANAEDKRLWVPKISGMGMTLNFAHPMAWPMMLLLLGAPLALVAFVVSSTS